MPYGPAATAATGLKAPAEIFPDFTFLAAEMTSFTVNALVLLAAMRYFRGNLRVRL